SRVLPEELRHGGLGRHSERECRPVIAIGLENQIPLLDRGRRRHGDRLLADVEMEESTDLPLRIRARRFFLEAPDQEHLPIIIEPALNLHFAHFFLPFDPSTFKDSKIRLGSKFLACKFCNISKKPTFPPGIPCVSRS